MISPARLTLRRAKAAARAGRYAEALELLRSGPVAEYRQAAELRAALAGKLAQRAAQQLERGWSAAALRDWQEAERAGAEPELLCELRAKMLDRAEQELRRYFEAGDPLAAAELGAKLTGNGLEADRLRQLCRAAQLWLDSRSSARAGNFADAARLLDVAASLLGPCLGLDSWRQQMQAAEKRFIELSRRLYEQLEAGNWPAVAECSAELASVAPDWLPGSRARQLAWGRLEPSADQLQSLRKLVDRTGQPSARAGAAGACSSEENGGESSSDSLILWVDGVGGYLLCLEDVVWVGQAVPGNRVQVPILADISRRHAALCRDAEGYVLAAGQRVTLNGQPVQRAAIGHGDRIKLGDSLELTVSLPCPASATAVLRISSKHRLPLSLSGIVLMAQSCLIGPTARAHITVPDATGSVTLYRAGRSLACRAPEPVQIGGGHAGSDRVRIECGVPVSAAGISFCCEPASQALGQA